MGRCGGDADALGVLLLTWNQAAYRYGVFDFGRLESFLKAKRAELEKFRFTRLENLPSVDRMGITELWDDLLDALTTASGSRSPVAAGKPLHLIAPRMFPLWDNKIAAAYGCRLYGAPRSAQKYLRFTEETQAILARLADERALEDIEDQLNTRARFSKPILKFIDEYNYARFTYGWI